MTDSTTLLYLTAAIARAELHIAELRRQVGDNQAAEPKTALELMELEKRRLERHRLAVATRFRGAAE